MKKAITISAGLFITMILLAQAPQKISYQAVIRNSSDQLVTETQVGMRISIMQGTADGSQVYTETHTPTTNANGLVSIEIGTGATGDNFSAIDWSDGPYFIKTETDPASGKSYTIAGTSQLLSVPFALYALKSGESIPLNVDYSVITPTCNGYSDGSILLSVIGGRPPYIFDWSNGATSSTLENIAAGIYTVTVTDEAGQFVSKQINLNEPQPLNLSLNKNDISCKGQMDGSISANINGGNGGYNYEWSTGSTASSINNLSTDTYSLTVTDTKNCISYASIEIIEPSTLSVSEVKNDVICFDDNDGEINLTVSGGTEPYNYFWSNFSMSEDISNLTVGNYNVTIRDNRNCSIEKSFEILSESSQITISSEKTDLKCKGDSDANIDITVSGGITPYTYSWSNGSTTQDVSGLVADSYSLTINDSKGCSSNFTEDIIEPSSEIIVAISSQPEFKNEADGTIDLTIEGGVPYYSVSWNNGSSTEDLNSLSSGTYSYLITDSNECQKSGDIVINKLSSVTDIDGNVYDLVKINDQVWMAENLKTTKFNDGWIITSLYYPDNLESNVSEYGYIYPLSVARSEKTCPSGWHIPNNEEWEVLINYLNGEYLAGGSMKESGLTHWTEPNTGATNQSGFTALPAGTVNTSYFNQRAYFWSSTIININANYTYLLYYNSSGIQKISSGGFNSIRCLKD